MADFQSNLDDFQAENMGLLAGSVDDRSAAGALVEDQGLSFPVAFGLDLEAVGRSLGGFYHGKDRYLQPSGFVLRPDGTLEVASYSSGPIGRLKAANVLALVRYYKQNRD